MPRAPLASSIVTAKNSSAVIPVAWTSASPSRTNWSRKELGVRREVVEVAGVLPGADAVEIDDPQCRRERRFGDNTGAPLNDARNRPKGGLSCLARAGRQFRRQSRGVSRSEKSPAA